jgi:hypothetical protein
VASGDTVPSLDRATRGDSAERGGTAGAESVGIVLQKDADGNAMFSLYVGVTEMAGQVHDKLNETVNHPGKLQEHIIGDRSGGTTYHIAAPIQIGDRAFVADVLVKSDSNTSRMYVHEMVLKEKLQQTAGDKPRSIQRDKDSTLVLDASDILDLLKQGAGPVILDESAVREPQKGGQPRGAAPRHPNITAEQWKKVPDWLDNPTAVVDSDTIDGHLVIIASELVGGLVVMITLDPRAQGARRVSEIRQLTNAYDKDGGPPPFSRWFAKGKALYVNKKVFPAVLRRFGLQLPETAYQNKPGTAHIFTEKNLDGYRRAQPVLPPTDTDIRFNAREIVVKTQNNLIQFFGNRAGSLKTLGGPADDQGNNRPLGDQPLLFHRGYCK